MSDPKYVEMHEVVDLNDPGKRDGPVCPPDPTLTRMADIVRYMRKNSMYFPPNPWPEGMLCFGVGDERLLSVFFVTILDFERMPEEALFGLTNPAVERLFFTPAQTMPTSNEDAQVQIRHVLANYTGDKLEKIITYLNANGWWCDNPRLARELLK